MYTIKTLNAISPVGLAKLPKNLFQVAVDADAPDGILVRSADLLNTTFNEELLAIARAGAGVNNIPLDRCSEQGIVVFRSRRQRQCSGRAGGGDADRGQPQCGGRCTVDPRAWPVTRRSPKAWKKAKNNLWAMRSRVRHWVSSAWERSAPGWRYSRDPVGDGGLWL